MMERRPAANRMPGGKAERLATEAQRILNDAETIAASAAGLLARAEAILADLDTGKGRPETIQPERTSNGRH